MHAELDRRLKRCEVGTMSSLHNFEGKHLQITANQVTLRADQGATMESRFSCECFIDEVGRRMQKYNIFLCIHLKKTLCLGSQALCLDSWALKFFKEN